MDKEEKMAIVDKEAKRFASILSNLGMKHVSFCFISGESSAQDRDYCSVFQIKEDFNFDRTFLKEGKKWK